MGEWVGLPPSHQADPLCRAMLRFKDDKGVQKLAVDAMLIPKITTMADTEIMLSLIMYYQFRSLAAPWAPKSHQCTRRGGEVGTRTRTIRVMVITIQKCPSAFV